MKKRIFALVLTTLLAANTMSVFAKSITPRIYRAPSINSLVDPEAETSE